MAIKDTLETVPREQIRPFKGQPRNFFDQAALKDLATSIKAIGQQVEIVVKPISGAKHKYELIDGQRRWLACGMAGVSLMRCVVRRGEVDADDQFVMSVVANFAREGHTPMEIAHAIERLHKRPDIQQIPNLTDRRIAIGKMFGRSFGWVYQFEVLLRLHPELQRRIEPSTPEDKRFSVRAAQFIAQLRIGEQLRTAEEVEKRGMRREEAVSYLRVVAAQRGTQADGSKSPDRRHLIIVHTLSLIQNNATKLGAISADEIVALVKDPPVGDQELWLRKVEASIEQLSDLRSVLRRVIEKRIDQNSEPASDLDETIMECLFKKDAVTVEEVARYARVPLYQARLALKRLCRQGYALMLEHGHFGLTDAQMERRRKLRAIRAVSRKVA